MEDQEFYEVKENWDLAPDTRVTLGQSVENLYDVEKRVSDDVPEQAEEKSRGKKRKKFLKGMALFTSAAVVIGAVSLSGHRHFGKGSSWDDEMVNEICPVCSTTGCEFYRRGRIHYQISADRNDPVYTILDQHYGIDTLGLPEYSRYTGSAIMLADGRRARLFSSAVRIPDRGYASGVSSNPGISIRPQTAAQTRYEYSITNSLDDAMNADAVYGGIVQLLYAPDGRLPEQYTDIYENTELFSEESGVAPFVYCIEKAVSEKDGLYLRSYSNYSREDAVQALNQTVVQIWDAGEEFALGRKLSFTESDSVRLSGEIHETCATHYYVNHEGVEWASEGAEYQLVTPYSDRAQAGDLGSIYVLEHSYEDICNYMPEREKEALSRGHSILAYLRKIDTFEWEGMGYTAYLFAAGRTTQEEDFGSTHWELLFVPDAEKNIAVGITLNASNVFAEDAHLDRIDEIRSLLDLNCSRKNNCTTKEDFLNVGFLLDRRTPADILNCIGER